jgi:hypothetical protein
MTPKTNLETIFIALAVIFVGTSFQDYLRSEGKLTPAGKTWLRMAFIFATVTILIGALRMVAH